MSYFFLTSKPQNLKTSKPQNLKTKIVDYSLMGAKENKVHLVLSC